MRDDVAYLAATLPTACMQTRANISSKPGMVVERATISKPPNRPRSSQSTVMMCAHVFLGPNDKQNDLDNGEVTNVARAVGYGPRKSGSDGENRSSTEAEGSAWVDLPQHASLQVCSSRTWARTLLVHKKNRVLYCNVRLSQTIPSDCNHVPFL